MATSKYAIFGMIICTFIITAGQILLKMGVDNFKPDLYSIITNYFLIFAFLFYGAGLIIMTLSYKYGEISVLYPIVSLNFIWVSLFSVFTLGENLNAYKISAILFIVVGIAFIGRGSKK